MHKGTIDKWGAQIPMRQSDSITMNGISATTGKYLVPSLTPESLLDVVLPKLANVDGQLLRELKWRHTSDTMKRLRLMEGIDPEDISETGWGVVFSENADPSIREAIRPLLDHRRMQAGDRYKEYFGADGYRALESKTDFLARHGVGPGPVDPSRIPYYLLLVGSPSSIPFHIQYQLDVQYAVGRVEFDCDADYAAYADNVVHHETIDTTSERRIVFFGTSHNDDKATRISTEHLVEPLAEQVARMLPGWQTNLVGRGEAMKSRLVDMLSGENTPKLLFSATHGLGFPFKHPLQVARQGALLCQDWPGPINWQGAIPPEFYYSAEDAKSAIMPGGIVFLFACFGAGTPDIDDFAQNEHASIAAIPFISTLAKCLLSRGRSAPLAVLGHVDRAWTYSFLWPDAGPQLSVFQSCLHRVCRGLPIGFAAEYFDDRYAELSTDLSTLMGEAAQGRRVDPLQLASLWTANKDARNYAIIGDPAVRLNV